MNRRLNTENMKRLFQAVVSLQNEEECARFFEDICTIHELESMAQRLEVAVLLKEGITYQEISDRTGASTATISRVGRALNYGEEGYDIVLERLQSQEQ
ncbi:MAG: helix-turn-helix domain-containing protein [Clostridiales bacterium]|nr:helix-turn-helix domain-containing protein [Clostridiales bacterium]